MITKSAPEEIQSYRADASYMQGGRADRLVLPEKVQEVAEILAAATRDRIPVTVSGAGTGTVGGRIPFGGIVLATDELNHVRSLVRNDSISGSAVVEPGVMLADFQKFVEAEGLFYPPDPTERGCFIGGTVATNASGARTFKYGPTRKYVQRLRIVLANGEVINLRRGDNFADGRTLSIPLHSGDTIEV